MKITDLNLSTPSNLVRIEADITWEETDRPPLSLFVETDAQFEDALWPDPNGFLLACFLPAWHAGERRVQVDGSLCPWLCENNLEAAIAILKTWYPELGTPPKIEPSEGFQVLPLGKPQAVSFLSCGIDSLATLRLNKLLLPPDCPAAIGGAIAIDYVSSPNISEAEANNRTRKRLEAAARVTADAGVALIPVRTNILLLDDDGYFFNYKWHGAVLSAIAHFFSQGFQQAYIASSFDASHCAAHIEPWGSHPLLDSYYSSAHFQIEHHGTNMSRYRKTALVADWPVGLQNILVCEGKNSGETNCGTCEKCIRTMTTLLSLGKLKDCQAFPLDDISPELLKTLREYEMYFGKYQAICYRDLLPGLANQGRDDLVDQIDRFLDLHKSFQASGQKSPW